MTQGQKNAFWYKWNRFQQRYENYFTTKFKSALQLQVKSFLKAKDVTAIPSYPIYDVLVNLYKTVGPAWATTVKNTSKKATGVMGFNEEILRLMEQYYGIDLLNDAELMTAASRDYISAIMISANQQGLSIDQITALLLNHPEFNEMRARRIARTETVTAANGAAMIYAMTSGNEMEKTWIAVKDKRTRHSHRNVDGTTVDINTPFFVNGTQMMQPGVRDQPNGQKVPAKEIVNCRCTVAFKAKRDSTGNLL